jgi:hypothetical protein
MHLKKLVNGVYRYVERFQHIIHVQSGQGMVWRHDSVLECPCETLLSVRPLRADQNVFTY